MRIAIVSLNMKWEDKKYNLQMCEDYIKKASLENIELIVFPEMSLTGFSINTTLIAEDKDKSETVLNFRKLANLYQISILFGMVEKDNDKALNKSILISKDGKLLGDYSKIHPFSFSGENKYFNAGNEVKVLQLNNFKIGLTICYDLRFPELYSALSKESDMIINIANWPNKRINHWNILLKARAIENQLYMIGVNRTGFDDNELEYKESSNIFNANGDKLKFVEYNNMKIYEIEKNWTKEFKTKFNTVNDKRIEFYKGVI